MLVLGIDFRTFFEKWPQCYYFADIRRSTGRNWQIAVPVLLAWLIIMHRLRKIPETSLMPGALFSSKFSSILNTLSDSFFATSK